MIAAIFGFTLGATAVMSLFLLGIRYAIAKGLNW